MKSQSNAERAKADWRTLSLIGLLALIMMMVVFAIQNAKIISVRMAAWEAEMNLSMVIIASLLFGVLIALIAILPVYWRTLRALRAEKREARRLRTRASGAPLDVNDKTLRVKRTIYPTPL